MNNIIYVAEHIDEISTKEIFCPRCFAKQFAPFDKLYVSAYGKCVDCSSSEEVETLGDNILALVT